MRPRQKPSKIASEQPPPVRRIRISYSKEGRLRFLSHLDMVKAWQLLIERAGLPVAFSRGFHPVALLQYAPALPVGYTGMAEWVDIFLRQAMTPAEVEQRLERAAPKDMRLFAPMEIDLSAPALDRSIAAADYEIRLSEEFASRLGLSADQIAQRWREGRESTEPSAAQRAGSLIPSLEIVSPTPPALHLRVVPSEGNLPDPLKLLRTLLGVEIRSSEDAAVTRLGLTAAPSRPSLARPLRR